MTMVWSNFDSEQEAKVADVWDNHGANARLIAVAPDLLEACELVERAWAGDGVDMSRAVDACLLVIAKVKGD